MTDYSHTENIGQEERWYLRFNYYHRFLHALVIISFLGLVFTGMPLKYSHTGWAQTLAGLMGGIGAAGKSTQLWSWHRKTSGSIARK